MKKAGIVRIGLLSIAALVVTSCSTKQDPEELTAKKDVPTKRAGIIERIDSKPSKHGSVYYLTLKDDSVVYDFEQAKQNTSSVRTSLVLAQAGDSIAFVFTDKNGNNAFDANTGSCSCKDDDVTSWDIIHAQEKAVAPQPIVVAPISAPVLQEKPKVIYRYRDRKPLKRDTVFLPAPENLASNTSLHNSSETQQQAGFTVRTDQVTMPKTDGKTVPYLEQRKYDENGKYIGSIKIDPITLEEVK